MKSLVVVLAVFTIIQLTQAQVVEVGKCNSNITTIQSFDASKYLGRWYEHEKYPFVFEIDGKCIYAEYALLENGDISVNNFNINQRSGKPSSIQGSARIVDSGKLKVSFSAMPAFVGAADYWILDTDYDNYAVVYTCKDIVSLMNTKVVWILTRERHPPSHIVEKAKNVIKQNGLSLDYLQITDQTGC